MKRNPIRLVLSALVALTLVFAIQGCALARNNENGSTPNNNEVETAATDEELIGELVDTTMAVFKNPTASGLTSLGFDFAGMSDDEIGDDLIAQYQQVGYSTQSIQVDGDTAEVVLDITSLDYDTIAKEAQDDFSAWRSEQTGSVSEEARSEAFQRFYQERLAAEDAPRNTNAVTLTCEKDADGTWQWNPLPASVSDFVVSLNGA